MGAFDGEAGLGERGVAQIGEAGFDASLGVEGVTRDGDCAWGEEGGDLD